MGRRSLLARIRIFSLIDATSSGTIDISDGTVLRLTGQDTSVALNASLFNGDGTLVNATDGDADSILLLTLN